MRTSLRTEPFDPWREVAEYQAQSQGSFGATSVFVGTMRAQTQGRDGAAHKMFLEHYPGMTEDGMEAAVRRAMDEHDVTDALVVHRVGDVLPGEPIVLIAVWSEHRTAACLASRQIREDLKSTVPFWKKEHFEDGAEWVKENTPATG